MKSPVVQISKGSETAPSDNAHVGFLKATCVPSARPFALPFPERKRKTNNDRGGENMMVTTFKWERDLTPDGRLGGTP